MRPIRNGGEEAGGGSNLQEKQSLAQLWDAWEIHCLILISLFLQVFLFLTAGMRRCSSSRVLGTILWLAYLSADSVAIFVLGHLAVHAEERGHQLMSFWAPFVLVHLGGQDTITALSKQDNELWRRHLLSLVSQVAVASYVVAMASWPDHHLLRAAMVIMFLSGSLKYAERTLCLYFASPERLRSDALLSLSGTLWQLTQAQGREGESSVSAARRSAEETLDMMSKGSISGLGIDGSVFDIMSVDAPFNKVNTILVAGDLPGMLAGFLSRADRYRAYEYVGARLVRCYQCIYTKTALREACGSVLWELVHDCRFRCFKIGAYCLLLCTLFQYASTPIALALFAAAEKGDQIHPISRADITVSYVLLIGAIVLDVSSAIMFIFSYLSFILPASSRSRSAILRVANYIQFAGSRNKQWSEELAQYSMIKRHTVQYTTGMASSIRQSIIGRCLGVWGVELFEVTHTPITEDQAPIKEFILDNLLRSGERKEWSIASSRGRLALGRWKGSHNQDPVCARKAEALEKSISADFPTTVLIWHIATDICYYGDKSSTDDSDQMTKHKNMSRQLSNYIMYLVFKCDAMLTSNSKLLHDDAHDEIREILLSRRRPQQVNLGEKNVVLEIFKAEKNEGQQQHSIVDIQKLLEAKRNEEQQHQIKKHGEPTDAGAADNHVQTADEALYSRVLPRAREVSQELISIKDAADRWGLIASVWLEMLYYTAPRCGGAFHYEHLSTGGELVTHVLLLMHSLGPFLPTTGA